jgi:uncharacterized membrane protein HdeD (DUF308 family)
MKDMFKEHRGMHMKHKGMMMFLLGALILLNVYLMKLEWSVFIGGFLVLGGLAKMMHGCCKKRKK